MLCNLAIGAKAAAKPGVHICYRRDSGPADSVAAFCSAAGMAALCNNGAPPISAGLYTDI